MNGREEQKPRREKVRQEKSMTCKQLTTRTVTLAVAALIAVGASLAQANDAILDLLVKKGVINQREANDIREQADADMAKQMEVNDKTKVAPFLQSMEWAGDMRLRAEYFSHDNVINGPRNTDRTRFRYRLRFGFVSKLQDWATVGVRLASGNNDAVSSNQTMGGYSSRKNIGIDNAYIAVTPPFADWLTVTGGKFDSKLMWQPAFASPMVYDFDTCPEGVVEQLSYAFGEQKQFRLFGNFGQFVLNEVNGTGAAVNNNDVYMYDFQVGVEAKTGPVKTTAVVGMYYTQNLGFVNRTTGPIANGEANTGNSVTGAGNYLDNFHVLYGRGEVAWTINDKTVLGTPNLVTFSGEYLRNCSSAYHAAGIGETGWTGQIAYGQNKKQGQWQLGYQYKRLEANATWDAMTDSDWGSSGGTDRKGHVFMAAYNIRDWWTFGIKTFVTEKISNTGPTLGSTTGPDLLRVQVDTVVKF
ncbi:MAG: putative porin [Verrucomicrobia bacterium]|nr:putative porin [Verrucomicrobiota bacterium]